MGFGFRSEVEGFNTRAKGVVILSPPSCFGNQDKLLSRRASWILCDFTFSDFDNILL